MKLVLTVVSTFGLGSILVVVVGRLWTIAYFEHFGLSAADLEFNIEDFAFRSLEVFISLVLAGAGVLLAWRARSILQWAGFRFLLLEIAGVIAAMAIMFWALEPLIEWQPSLSKTGILGIISGVVLILMIFVVADIWFGSEDSGKARGHTENGGTPRSLLLWLMINWHKLIAAGMMLGIVFVYVPFVTESLAKLQAEIDLEKGRLPAAILESFSDALPSAIASDADPNKSTVVRVILSQRENTYVLSSTQCTVIGELEVIKVEEGGILATRSDFCKVFAIPTSRLKSIEYVQVSGSPPSNDTRFLAEQVDLTEPFSTTVFTKAASDDDDIQCRNGTDSGLKRTIWYGFSPSTDGTLLARVTSLDPGLTPVIGIWEELEEGVLQVDAAPGSGSEGLACEGRAVFLPRRISPAPGDAKRVATIASIQADRSYLIVVGNQEERGGSVSIDLEFTPGASALFPTIPRHQLPSVTLPSTRGLVQLELRQLNTVYELRRLGSGGFSLVPQQGEAVPVMIAEDQQDKRRTLLEAELDPGVWTLEIPENFVGQVRLTTIVRPVVLAFADRAAAPLNDIRVQGALLLVVDPVEIRDSLGLGGRVIFDPESFDPGARTFEAGEDAASTARELLDQAEIGEEFTVQIQIEVSKEEERKTLVDAARVLQGQLLGLALDVAIAPCENVCIRVFVGSEAL